MGIDMYVSPSTSIVDLKKKILHDFGVPPKKIDECNIHPLVFQGRELSELLTVKEACLCQSHKTILLFRRKLQKNNVAGLLSPEEHGEGKKDSLSTEEEEKNNVASQKSPEVAVEEKKGDVSPEEHVEEAKVANEPDDGWKDPDNGSQDGDYFRQ